MITLNPVNGSIEISAMIDYHLVTKTYYGYTKVESVEDYLAEFGSTHPELREELMVQLKPNIRCYDSGGEFFDRYTVIYLDEPERGRDTFTAVGMSEHPFHPQGFGQHCTATSGRHLGKLIAFEDLPEDCQKLVKRDLGDTQ